MKTLEFEGKERIVRDWLDMTGADWMRFGEIMGALNAAGGKEFAARIDEMLNLLAPDHVAESRDWPKETRVRFLFQALPDPVGFDEALESIKTAMKGIQHPSFEQRLQAWVDAKEE
jgi:hypothetical protein